MEKHSQTGQTDFPSALKEGSAPVQQMALLLIRSPTLDWFYWWTRRTQAHRWPETDGAQTKVIQADLGRGETGGARRRQAVIGCCWGVGVATAGGSSAWTMLPGDGNCRRTNKVGYKKGCIHGTKTDRFIVDLGAL